MSRHPDQRGQVVPLVALLLIALLIIVALVVDTAQFRSDRQTNKRLTDSAAAAGAQDLQVGPWRAVCTAYEYTLANAAGFTSFNAESWSDSASPPNSYSAPAGSCPTTGVSYSAPCTDDPSTWAHFRGSAAGGKVIVDIESGYNLPDPAFAEDTSISNDNGQPCDQVSVIETQVRPTVFGGVAGATSGTTTVRSVARIDRGPGQVGALVVLERTDCRAVDATTNGGELVVNATADTPGQINVDSDGTTSCSGSQRVVQGSALPGGGPDIIARPTTSGKSGRISIYALGNHASVADTASCAYSATPPSSCTIMPIPTKAGRLGRAYLDQRYLSGVRSAVSTAITAFSSTSGYTTLSTVTGVGYNQGNNTCTVSTPINVSAQNVYIDCNLNVNNGGTLRLSGANATIVAQGTINVTGSSGNQGPGILRADQPKAFYVAGTTQGANPISVDIGGTLTVNDGGTGTCPTPTSGNPTSVMVVKDGALRVNGGITLCQTAVIMASGFSASGAPPTAWPTSNNALPYDNSFTGVVTISGQGTVDWTAPNAVPNGPATQNDWTNHLEDLTLWTETSSSSTIGGQGTVVLGGVFALPNSNPFTIGGTGSQNISADAQFWTRKLSLSGQAFLQMAPNPNDSIPIIDFVLVR